MPSVNAFSFNPEGKVDLTTWGNLANLFHKIAKLTADLYVVSPRKSIWELKSWTYRSDKTNHRWILEVQLKHTPRIVIWEIKVIPGSKAKIKLLQVYNSWINRDHQ